MAEENEVNAGRKRRVIHWNPDAGKQEQRQRWTWPRIAAWTAGGSLGLLLAAGLVIRGIKLVWGPEVFQPRAVDTVAAAPTVEGASSAFISRAKAEQAFELASKALKELRRLPTDHPSQLEQLIVMEKSFTQSESLMKAHEFARAFGLLETLNQDIDAFSRNVKAKGEARQAYDAILLRVKDLEAARVLAPGKLEAAFESAGAGRQLMTDGNFTGAKQVFDRGFAELKLAEQALQAFVRDNLLAGQKSLAAGEKDSARKAFQQALEKAPGNEAATLGLKRAENIDRVHALLQQGAQFEQEKRFAEAAESYKKAFSLDGFSAAAQEGQSRAARLEKETRFAEAKAAADEAVKVRDWNKAITELQNALKVHPQKADVQAQLKAARDSAHRESVQKALARAFEHEKAFQWNEARAAFNETLQLDPDHPEAKDGYKRAGTVIRALLQYERYIEAADQLANKADFQGAIRRFNEAMAVKPAYLQASDRVQQLQALLMAQNTPVDVTFKSDDETWVQITNFRAPKKFQSETIKILPGNYEVVGRRRGYRDVVMLLQVRGGVPAPEVSVICSVKADK